MNNFCFTRRDLGEKKNKKKKRKANPHLQFLERDLTANLERVFNKVSEIKKEEHRLEEEILRCMEAARTSGIKFSRDIVNKIEACLFRLRSQ